VGLYTAVVAGFLSALFGGSTVAVGGPTGAFVVTISGILAQHGYAGLATVTLMAGVFLIGMGLARFGAVMKLIPASVITGFTSGIAVIIISLQLRELLGLTVSDASSAQFLTTCWENLACMHTINGFAVGIAGMALALILGLRRVAPKAPAYLIAVVVCAACVAWTSLPVATIGSKFGAVPSQLPSPALPVINLQEMIVLLPSAVTIAMLCALESLLCALVADGIVGTRHKSDAELVGQGIANIGSVVFHGIPATGAIARTAANIRMGAKTPMASMVHAGVMLLAMVFFAPYAELIPLPALSAILLVVAWQMSDFKRWREVFRGDLRDFLVLVTCFLLTVLVDLTVAVCVGVALSLLLHANLLKNSKQAGV
jgi:SulP family sulfate permease